jgi:hypothetical protein
MSARKPKPDIITANYGSIIVIEPSSRKGRLWLLEHVHSDHLPIQCEHRYGVDILQRALAAGLRLQDSATGQP